MNYWKFILLKYLSYIENKSHYVSIKHVNNYLQSMTITIYVYSLLSFRLYIIDKIYYGCLKQ